MKPKTAAVLGIAALLALASLPSAFAQSATEGGGQTPGAAPAAPESPPQSPADGEVVAEDALSANPFLRGDQTISLSIGLHIPLFILPDTSDERKLDLGGSFSFGYQYFVARGLALGGTIAGAFNSTIGDRSLFVAPLSFRTAYWWSFMPFEFDVAAEVGGYISRLSGNGMLGPFAKVGGGAYWRGASSWSVGLQSYLWIVPEIHVGDYADLTQTAGFVEVAVTAVYHL